MALQRRRNVVQQIANHLNSQFDVLLHKKVRDCEAAFDDSKALCVEAMDMGYDRLFENVGAVTAERDAANRSLVERTGQLDAANGSLLERTAQLDAAYESLAGAKRSLQETTAERDAAYESLAGANRSLVQRTAQRDDASQSLLEKTAELDDKTTQLDDAQQLLAAANRARRDFERDADESNREIAFLKETCEAVACHRCDKFASADLPMVWCTDKHGLCYECADGLLKMFAGDYTIFKRAPHGLTCGFFGCSCASTPFEREHFSGFGPSLAPTVDAYFTARTRYQILAEEAEERARQRREEEAARLPHADEANVKEVLAVLWERISKEAAEKALSCPNCYAPIHKTEGCLKMHCVQCDHDLCYSCCNWSRPHHVHDHIENPAYAHIRRCEYNTNPANEEGDKSTMDNFPAQTEAARKRIAQIAAKAAYREFIGKYGCAMNTDEYVDGFFHQQ